MLISRNLTDLFAVSESICSIFNLISILHKIGYIFSVKWSRNDVLLQENDQMQFLSLGDWYGLEVFEALPRHEGLYTIRLENSSGFVTSSCRVEMKLPKEEPKFFRTEEDILEGFFHK